MTEQPRTIDELSAAAPRGKAVLWDPRNHRVRYIVDPHPQYAPLRVQWPGHARQRGSIGRLWRPTQKGWDA